MLEVYLFHSQHFLKTVSKLYIDDIYGQITCS